VAAKNLRRAFRVHDNRAADLHSASRQPDCTLRGDCGTSDQSPSGTGTQVARLRQPAAAATSRKPGNLLWFSPLATDAVISRIDQRALVNQARISLVSLVPKLCLGTHLLEAPLRFCAIPFLSGW